MNLNLTDDLDANNINEITTEASRNDIKKHVTNVSKCKAYNNINKIIAIKEIDKKNSIIILLDNSNRYYKEVESLNNWLPLKEVKLFKNGKDSLAKKYIMKNIENDESLEVFF